LINNYDMLLSVVNASTTSTGSSSKSEEVNEFEAMLQKSIREYADECLSAPFGGLMSFVRCAVACLHFTSQQDPQTDKF
jgi:hypothetical protein